MFAQANVYNFSKGAPNSTNKCLVAVVFHPTIIIMGTDKEDWINTIDYIAMAAETLICRTLMLFRYWFSDQFFMSLVLGDLTF